MKEIILILIIFWGLFTVGSAQEIPETIEIDFSAKTIKTPNIENIKKNGYYQIKIKHINLNLYKVTLAAVDTILSKPQQTPAFGNFNLDAISKVVSGISPISTTKLRPDVAALSKGEYINNRMLKEIKSNAYNKYLIEKRAMRIDNLKLEVYKIRLGALKLDYKHITNLDINNELYYVSKLRDSIAMQKDMIIKDRDKYDLFVDSFMNEIALKPGLIENNKFIKESYGNLLITLTDLLSSISADKTNELLSPIVFIENNKNNTYLSLPFQFTGEQAKVKISIIPRDEKYNLQSYHTQILIPQELKYYRVVGLSLYGSSLYDKAYSIIEHPEDTTYIIKEADNISKGELGIAALLHYGRKLNETTKYGIHFNLGAGISISDKIKPRLLLGGGFSFGERHKLVIDGGLIVGYVNELSSTLELEHHYTTKPEIITISNIDYGGFGSIGYLYQF